MIDLAFRAGVLVGAAAATVGLIAGLVVGTVLL